MPTITRRPSATSNPLPQWVLFGAATRHAAVSDGGAFPAGVDSSYVWNPYDYVYLAFGLPPMREGIELPAAGTYKVLGVRVNVRGWKGTVLTNSVRTTTKLGPSYDPHEDDHQMLLGSGLAAGYQGFLRTKQPDGNFWVPAGLTGMEVLIRGNNAVDISISEVWVDTVYVNAPVVVVLTPTGTLGFTRTTCTFTYTQEDGRNQTLAEMKVFTAAQVQSPGFNPATTAPVFASGIRSGGATELKIGGEYTSASGSVWVSDLQPGNYVVYARAACDVVGQTLWSAWDSEPFTVATSQPAKPILVPRIDAPGGKVDLEILGTDNFLSSFSGEADVNDSSTPTGQLVGGPSTTLARDTTAPYAGAASWALTNTGGTADRTLAQGNYVLGDVIPGQKYSAGVQAKWTGGGGAARNVRVSILWFDEVSFIAVDDGAAVSVGSGAWANPVLVGAIAPPTARYAQLVVTVVGMTNGQVFKFDQLVVRPGTDPSFVPGGMANRNLLTSNESTGAGTDTTGYEIVAGSLTLARDTGQHLDGTSSLKITGPGSPTFLAVKVRTKSRPAVSAGLEYTAFASYKAASGAAPAFILTSIHWFDSTGTFFAQSDGPIAGDTNTAWTQAAVTAVAPVGAVSAAVCVVLSNAFVTEIHYVDCLSLSRSDSLLFIPGELAAHSSFAQVRYTDDDGESWANVRDSPRARDHQQRITLYDREASPGDVRVYEALTVVDPLTGTNVSPPSDQVVASLDSRVWWLKDVLEPGNSIARNLGFLVGETEDTVNERAGVYELLGSSLVIVISDAMGGIDGRLRITSIGQEEFRAFRTLLMATRTLLLVDPLEREQRYIRFVGERSWTKRATSAGTMRDVSVAFREVPRP